MALDKINPWSNTSRTSDRPEFTEFNKDQATTEEQTYLQNNFEYKPKHNRLDLQAHKIVITDNSRHLHYGGEGKSRPVMFHVPPIHPIDQMPDTPNVNWGNGPAPVTSDIKVGPYSK